MSFPPITIPDLDPASTINRNTDLILLRQGANDRKATLAQINDIDFSSYTTLTNAPLATDVFLVGRNIGGGNYQNYRMLTSSVSFIAGVQIWFYSQTAPNGWQIVAGQGDRILGVISDSGSGVYNNYGIKGDWQQKNHTLTVLEIPPHHHAINASSDNLTSDSSNYARNGKSDHARQDIITKDTGGGIGHNHGNDWRPAACCGRICSKL